VIVKPQGEQEEAALMLKQEKHLHRRKFYTFQNLFKNGFKTETENAFPLKHGRH
jgi:hypothetical protein